MNPTNDNLDDNNSDGENVDDDAASPIPQLSGNENNQYSSDGASDHDDDARQMQIQSAETDDRELSEYERQRLERIERNKAYLEQLGLHDIKAAPKARQKKREPETVNVKSRFSSRASAKPVVSYAEPSLSVAALVRQEKAKNKMPKEKRPPKEPKPKKEKTIVRSRLERPLYDEFQRLHKHKKQILRQVERDVRAAEKEIKFWTKRVGVLERKEQRQLDKAEGRPREQQVEQDRDVLGGYSKRDLLLEVDRRREELVALAEKYDDEFEAEERAMERKLQRFETEAKNKTLDALDRFPKALQDSHSLLNSLLLQRLPKDLPPPRRSRRASLDAVPDDATYSAKKRTRIDKDDDGYDAQKPPAQHAQWEQLPSELPASSVPDADADAGQEEDESGGGGQNSTSISTTTRIRTRSVRNVGGWISPNLSKLIDRSWLERDAPLPAGDAIDLTTYAPQVGETVLYYPLGHKTFLSKYPDVLGKKLRSMQRIPLWERPCQAEERLSGNLGDPTKRWWSDQWLEDMENGTASYPVLCRVDRSYAEFPPDPFTKVLRKKGGSNEDAQVTWKAPKDLAAKEITGTPLRLSLVLRPLTPLVPPGVDDVNPPPLPPIFSVVTFPSKLKPFIVPFSYGYSLAHSLALDEKVTFAGSKCKITAFAACRGVDTARFDDKMGELFNLVARLDAAVSVTSFLEEALPGGSKGFPIRDCHTVIDTLRRHTEQGRPAESSVVDTNPVDLMALISRTLPLWSGVCLRQSVYDRKLIWASAWEVKSASSDALTRDYSPDQLAARSFDEAMRRKLETVVEDFAWDNQAAGDLLYYSVTDDDAPSYSCAVPLSMSLERVLTRFGDDSEIDGGCFYRSMEHVLSDIGLILENCLLYNAPDSAIVESASLIIPQLKDGVSRASQAHLQELLDARRADEERRQLVMSMSHKTTGLPTSEADAPKSRGPVLTTLRLPYEGMISQDWLQEWDRTSDVWVPQAGDRVQYSHLRHATFVQGHFPSLEPEQCSIHTHSSGTGDPSDGEWLLAKVVWTRAAFPKVLSKKSIDDQTTFPAVTTLLAVGIKADGEDDIFVVYYRPCGAKLEGEGMGVACGACGLDGYSFLRLDVHGMGHDGRFDAGVPDKCLASVEQCLLFLKNRCIKQQTSSAIDPGLNKSSVKQGYKTPKPKLSFKHLPSYEDILSEGRAENALSTDKGTRGVKAKSTPSHSGNIGILAEMGFLPNWVVRTDQLDSIRKVSPWTKMSLELVLLRLKHGYYRHKSAVSNDIVESFVASVIMLLFEPASRKRSPLQAKRVVRLSNRATVEDSFEFDKPDAQEEYAIAARIRKVREVHAMALVSVTDTHHIERLFNFDDLGSASIVTITSNTTKSAAPTKDPVREVAREKLALLLKAVEKDQLLNVFGQKFHGERASIPKSKLIIMCEGSPVSNAKYFKRVSTAIADLEDGRSYAVTVRANKKIVSCLAEADEEDADPSDIDNDEAEKIVDLHDSCVTVMCDKKPVAKASDKLVASLPGRLGNPMLVRKVEDCISFDMRDYEANEAMVKFIFGRPGRKEPCARCQAFKRSLFCCRVRRSHSNIDYDWISNFRGVAGIDGLLSELDPDYKSELVPESPDSSRALQDNAAEDVDDAHDDDENKEDDDDDNKDDEDEDFSNPREQLEKAKHTLVFGRTLLKQAQEYSERPVRFSSDFIKSVYPVDPSDNHYVYCIICGLSGDLLCCDGCSNVVHSDCIGLIEVPEGDWYCEECSTSKAPAAPTIVADGVSPSRPGDGNCKPRTIKVADIPVEERLTGYASLDSLDILPTTDSMEADLAKDDATEKDATPKPNDEDILSSQALVAAHSIVQSIMALKYGPFQRAEFDDSAAERLNALLVELNEARPVRLRLKLRLEEPPTKDNENETSSATKRGQSKRVGDELKAPAIKRRHRRSHVVRPEEEVVELEATRFGRKRARTQFLSENTIIGNFYGSNDPSERSRMQPSRSPRKSMDSSLWDDPFDRLNVTAQRFLATLDITTAEEFLGTRTGDIADPLISWRQKQNLPLLKGSGAIATVSGWKSQCRDAAREMGMDELATLEPARDRPSSGVGDNKRRRRSAGGITGGDDAIECLSAVAREFLYMLEIKSAEAFLAAKTGEVAKDLVDFRKKEGMPVLKGSGAVATIAGWKTLVRSAIDSSVSQPSEPNEVKSSVSKPKEIPNEEPASDSESGDDDDENDGGHAATDRMNFEGSLSGLPEYGQRFLISSGITTAAAFLETKSSELSKVYVKWRQRQGMPVLKGSGPGAHIGAWKAIARKAPKTSPRKRKRSSPASGEHEQRGDNEDAVERESKPSAASPASDSDSQHS